MRLNLVYARKEKNLKRSEMAKSLDVAYETYCQYETGRRCPSGKVIIRLEQFFGIPASELLAESEEEAITN